MPYDSELKYHFHEPKLDYVELSSKFKENNEWEVEILQAPICPTVNVIRLIKSARYNSDIRRYIRSHMKNQGVSNEGVFFLIALESDSSKQETA